MPNLNFDSGNAIVLVHSVAANTGITVPIKSGSGVIDWGDGTTTAFSTGGNVTKTYDTDGL